MPRSSQCRRQGFEIVGWSQPTLHRSNDMAKEFAKPRLAVLNAKHPLCRGLVADYPFHERGGASVRDIAKKQVGTFGSATNPAWATALPGSCLTFDSNAASYIPLPTVHSQITSKYTLCAWIRRSAASTIGNIFRSTGVDD